MKSSLTPAELAFCTFFFFCIFFIIDSIPSQNPRFYYCEQSLPASHLIISLKSIPFQISHYSAYDLIAPNFISVRLTDFALVFPSESNLPTASALQGLQFKRSRSHQGGMECVRGLLTWTPAAHICSTLALPSAFSELTLATINPKNPDRHLTPHENPLQRDWEGIKSNILQPHMRLHTEATNFSLHRPLPSDWPLDANLPDHPRGTPWSPQQASRALFHACSSCTLFITPRS